MRAPFRDRLRYRIDGLLSRGPVALVVVLLATTAFAVLGITLVVVGTGWGLESGYGFLDVLWRALLATIDPGTAGNFTGGSSSPGFLLSLLAATLAGIFVTSILIGILVTAIQGRLDHLRKGRSRVVESGQTVILGWSQQVFTIIGELVVANANQRRSAIVVLAPRDKVEMEDEIRARVGRTGRTKIVCRTGSPIDLTDLRVASVETAKSIIVLAPDVEDPDTDVIKTILAITNSPDRRAEPYHIVAELRDADSLEVARIVGRDEVQLVLVGDLIARIMAQTCRQSGLSIVYTELLDFEGDEIYEADPPAGLVGGTFGESLLAYDDSTIIAISTADGQVRLNPPMDTRIEAGDRLIAISQDDDTVRPASIPVGGIRTDLIVPPRPRAMRPERTLILGWNRRGPSIVQELDAYVAPDSMVVVRADRRDLDAAPTPDRDGLVNATIEIRPGDPTDRKSLTSLCAERFDHVIVLCSDVLDPQRADARTLIVLIHLRDIVGQGGYDFSITSEMLDLRNRALAEVTRADDFIVSDRMASLLLGQLSENRHLKAVFDDLFDRAGSEIFLNPAADYVRTGESMTFATVVEAARQRGEVAIGYRHVAEEALPERAHGVVVNPVKSVPLVLAAQDRIIVLAEAGS